MDRITKQIPKEERPVLTIEFITTAKRRAELQSAAIHNESNASLLLTIRETHSLEFSSRAMAEIERRLVRGLSEERANLCAEMSYICPQDIKNEAIQDSVKDFWTSLLIREETARELSKIGTERVIKALSPNKLRGIAIYSIRGVANSALDELGDREDYDGIFNYVYPGKHTRTLWKKFVATLEIPGIGNNFWKWCSDDPDRLLKIALECEAGDTVIAATNKLIRYYEYRGIYQIVEKTRESNYPLPKVATHIGKVWENVVNNTGIVEKILCDRALNTRLDDLVGIAKETSDEEIGLLVVNQLSRIKGTYEPQATKGIKEIAIHANLQSVALNAVEELGFADKNRLLEEIVDNKDVTIEVRRFAKKTL